MVLNLSKALEDHLLGIAPESLYIFFEKPTSGINSFWVVNVVKFVRF